MKKVLGIGFISVMVVCLSFIILKLFAPASLGVHLQINKWNCEHATFLMDRENPLAIIESKSFGGYRTSTLKSLIVVDLKKHQIIGDYYQYSQMNVLGITSKNVWVYEDGELLGLDLSNLEEKVNASEKLNKHPELSEKIDKIEVDGLLDDLRVFSKDGYEYSYNSKLDQLIKLDSTQKIRPNLRTKNNYCGSFRTPQKISNVPILSGKWVDNLKTNCVATFENEDRLLQHNTFINQEGEFLLSRVNDEGIIWQLKEKAIKTKADLENPSLQLTYLDKSTCYLFFQELGGTGDIFLLKVDPKTGKIRWSLEIT